MSKVVLRKFAVGRDQRLSVFDSYKKRVFRTGPSAVFRVPNYISDNPLAAENRWGLVETKLPAAYAALERRVALDDRMVVDLLRDVLALHWARSAAIRTLHERISQDIIQESMQRHLQNPELLGRIYRDRTGLVPTGIEALLWANDELHRHGAEAIERQFAERNAAHYQRAREYFSTLAVQVGYAGAGDFLIGDAPVLTPRRDLAGLGPHQGVGLMQANEVCMPLSPNILICLARKPDIRNLSSEQVEYYNTQQLNAFIRYVACRPGGASDSELRAAANTSR